MNTAARTQQPDSRSVWSRLGEPVVPFLVGVGFSSVAVVGAWANPSVVGKGGICMGIPNPRGNAWLLIALVAFLLTLVAAVIYTRRGRRRRRDLVDQDAQRQDQVLALAIWIAEAAVVAFAWIRYGTWPRELELWHAVAFAVFAIPAAILTSALITLVLDWRHKRHLRDQSDPPTGRTRAASAGIMVAFALLALSAVSTQLFLPATEPPPYACSQNYDAP